MVAYSLAQRLNPHLAPVAAGGVGVLAALAAWLVPGSMFEDMVLTSGVAAFIPAAEPPLGRTARLCFALCTGGGAMLLAWGGLSLVSGAFPPRLTNATRRPNVRRADAHPDAPPREPLRAGRDLGFAQADEAEAIVSDVDIAEPSNDLPPDPVIAMGAPTGLAAHPLSLDIPADPPPPPPVQPLPADFDQPLAAFDPAALLDEPLPVPPAVAPLVRNVQPPIFAEGERFETFDLAPRAVELPSVVPISGPDTVATVHSLLDRLERGLARRVQPVEPQPGQVAQGLESTLETLRRMAVRA